ncbi:MAG: Sua5/YciO/YrdC/YwlC family protein [Gemmatimonadetes bacterium]|nr:Sua5/YciO/YrdC/YwlC family protein [Gemmatimonadota bacterium]
MSTASFSVPFWSPPEVEASLRETIEHLQNGGVLAYPTETVYGFGTAVDHDAVETLVQLKHRPPGQAVPPAHRRERHAGAARPRPDASGVVAGGAPLARPAHARAHRGRSPRPASAARPGGRSGRALDLASRAAAAAPGLR